MNIRSVIFKETAKELKASLLKQVASEKQRFALKLPHSARGLNGEHRSLATQRPTVA